MPSIFLVNITHHYAYHPKKHQAKEMRLRNLIEFLYHLAGSSRWNINTIYIDAATAPAAASWEQEWESQKQKIRKRNRERDDNKGEKWRERLRSKHFQTKCPAQPPEIKQWRRWVGAREAGELPKSREESTKGEDRWEDEGREEERKDKHRERWRIDSLLHCHQEFISSWEGVKKGGTLPVTPSDPDHHLPVYLCASPRPTRLSPFILHSLHIPLSATFWGASTPPFPST